jgi:hypothetical protein
MKQWPILTKNTTNRVFYALGSIINFRGLSGSLFSSSLAQLELLQHLCSGEACDRMPPAWSQLHHGNQEEFPLRHARMRHLQHGQVNNLTINGYDIYVHKAVHIVAMGITMGSATQLPLNVMKTIQHGKRGVVRVNDKTQIQEAVITLIAPRLALDNA